MKTTRVIRVEFTYPSRFQYCSAPGITLQPGEMVVVETDWGVGMGEVGAVLEEFPAEILSPMVRPILRKATPTDLSRRAALSQRERQARAFCLERIRIRQLPMKLTEVRIGLDSSKAMFYFTADGRVDFRELVKDLVQHLRTRVELRQIGVRDEAKVLGCTGACGRPCCCRVFLQGFAPVSIRMAKDQNLALNPGKLSGICGRLKCCLAYEHPLYAELKRSLPKVGAPVDTSRGPGTVRAQDILQQTLLVGLETGGQVTLKAGEVTARPRSEPPPRHRPHARRDAGRPADRDQGRGASHTSMSRPAQSARPEPAPAEADEPAANSDDTPPEIAILEDP